MHRMMGPVVQAGIDAEAKKNVKYVAKKMAEEMRAKGKAAGVFA